MIPAGPRWIDTLRFMKQDPVFSECDLMDLMVNTYLDKYHEYHDFFFQRIVGCIFFK